jgi:hypothetical protein
MQGVGGAKRKRPSEGGTGSNKSRSIAGAAQDVPHELIALTSLETPNGCSMSTYEPSDF